MQTVFENATEILLLLFLIITFLQSGLDKVFDWGGNLSWLKGHFSKSPLHGMVPAMLVIILICEVLAGVFCAIGLYQIAMDTGGNMAFYGALLSCVSLLMLLFGQRVAKDYEGAKTVVIYFIPAIFLVFLLQQ